MFLEIMDFSAGLTTDGVACSAHCFCASVDMSLALPLRWAS